MKLFGYRRTVNLLATALVLTATGCSWYVSPGANHGAVNADTLVFPEQDSAWQKSGKIVDKTDIAKIKVGSSKEQIYQAIGTPHFKEGFNAREWDYMLKFYDANDDLETCQFKIIFDNNYEGRLRGGEFYATQLHWQPASCAKYAS